MYQRITQYLEALEQPNIFFDRLKKLKPILDKDNNLYFVSGGNSVVFRAEFEGRMYAIKCYTNNIRFTKNTYKFMREYFAIYSSPYIPFFEFMDEEVLIYNEDGKRNKYPVIKMDWIEGNPLGLVIRDSVYFGRKDDITQLVDSFLIFAIDMLEAEFSHGDLKHDNIIVDSRFALTLIDLDAVYTPNMTRLSSVELGTRWYQHPRRDTSHFDRHSDDYAIAVIATSLLALEQNLSLYDKYCNEENILFDPVKIYQGEDPAYKNVLEMWADNILYKELLLTLSSRTVRIANLYDVIQKILYTRRQKKKRGRDKVNGKLKLITDSHGRYGYVDAKGLVAIASVYDDATAFEDGLAAVKSGGRWAYINTDGTMATKFIYDEARQFSNGIAIVKQDDKWIAVGRSFRKRFNFEYDMISDFSDTLAAVKKGNMWGYIHKNGSLAIDMIFEMAKPFVNKKAVVRYGGRYGVINTSGEFIIDPIYSAMRRNSRGQIIAEEGGKEILLTLKK